MLSTTNTFEQAFLLELSNSELHTILRNIPNSHGRLFIAEIYMAVLTHSSNDSRTKPTIYHGLCSQVCHQWITLARDTKFDIIDTQSTIKATRVDNFYTIIEYQDTDGGMVQQIKMYKRILKQLFQYNFRYFKSTVGQNLRFPYHTLS